MRDDELRATCFLALDAMRAQLGEELPYRGGLDRRFRFRRSEVPFLSTQKGIFRAAVQTGPAALAVQTSARSPYRDAETEDGFVYDYRAGSVDQPDNRALRAAYELGVPLVYFVGVRPGVYSAEYPVYVEQDDPAARQVLLSPGRRTPSGTPRPITDELDRRYAVVEIRARLHQRRFRSLVLPAYRHQCAVCRLRHVRLLDAAHILGDAHERGQPRVSNGLSLCTIHHRAFDEHLVGIDARYTVHVSRRLLEDDDGPMLDVLKGCHSTRLEVPRAPAQRPDPHRLAERFDVFRAAG